MIVNVGSVVADVPQPNAAAYVASKAGLVGLTRSLALELAPRGVRVALIAPGDIATGASDSYRTASGVGGALRSGSFGAPGQSNSPIGRRGRPTDVAAAVGFLCSDDASFINGRQPGHRRWVAMLLVRLRSGCRVAVVEDRCSVEFPRQR